MTIYTIGFTKRSAENFFETLKDNDISKIIDIRINNTSHLASFAKKEHLEYFLKELCNLEYYYYPDLAPTNELFKNYKKEKIGWEDYEQEFISLLEKRRVKDAITEKDLTNACMLCSEFDVKNCHRRLVAEYFADHFVESKIVHL
ncbi:DUF488 domain-containing protein [Fuchsiella alkaliacetigena]|uniref:DUF488 domain-containing protein n=1 Tax=Fuchsiella alkaliacetigena TaxID=957042 RepID=UPI00200A2158|nr:DUF488 domain-containing protein [Fuchsiella alkaliacetigena]MCK8824341.1 DUF488 domain-containing protein [Fuchsiella alkaliacetigena]